MSVGRRIRACALAALVACGACQTYRPLELGDVRRGARVRVVVDPPVQVRLRDITIEQARSVEAEAVGVQRNALVLSALWVERSGGIGSPGEGWTVRIPLSSVAKLTERRVARVRTGLLLGALAVGTTVGWKVFGVGGSGGLHGNGGGEQL